MAYYFDNHKFPATLYKFRSFNSSDAHLRLLSHNEFYIPSPSKFNDPFDSKIPISFEFDSFEQILPQLSEDLKLLEPSLTEAGRIKRIRDLHSKGKFTDPEYLKMAIRETEEFPGKRLGVYSLAGSYKSILLWSHYAASHTGFVVGFHRRKLQHACSLSYSQYQKLMVLLPVEYSSQFPTLNKYKNSKDERFRKQLLAKAIDWKYEGEYRLILQDGPNVIVNFPNQVFSRVILGCQISDANRQQLINVLNQRGDHLPLYQAKRAEQSFSLVFTKYLY
jgi:hypothetical protein